MQGNADRCIANTLVYEGGYGKNAKDRGDWTSGKIGVGRLAGTAYGIAAMTLKERGLPEATDMRNISRAQAIELYKAKEWSESYGDRWPKGLDQVTFDAVVNSGKGRLSWSVKACGGSNLIDAITKSVNATFDERTAMIKKQVAIRLAFLRSLAIAPTFIGGWTKRCVGMEALGVKMNLEAAAVPAAEQARKLEAEAKTADKKKAGAAVTGTASAAPAATANQIDLSTFDWTAWVFVGGVALIVVAAVVFFAFQWWKNHERSKAYRAVAAGTLGA